MWKNRGSGGRGIAVKDREKQMIAPRAVDAQVSAGEAFVLEAGPEQDAGLLTLLGAIEGRRLQVFGPTSIGEAALHVRLPQGV